MYGNSSIRGVPTLPRTGKSGFLCPNYLYKQYGLCCFLSGNLKYWHMPSRDYACDYLPMNTGVEESLMSPLISNISFMLSPLVAGGIKSCVTVWRHRERTFDAYTRFPWTSPPVPFPFADYALSPFAIINHSHKCDYRLSPELLGNHRNWGGPRDPWHTHTLTHSSKKKKKRLRILPNVSGETKSIPSHVENHQPSYAWSK